MKDMETNINSYTEITENEIKMNFIVDGEEYVVLNEPEENDTILIAKVVDVDDEIQTLVSLTDEEYEKAFNEYISIIEDLEDE